MLMASILESAHMGHLKDVVFDHYGRRIATCAADEKARIQIYDQDESGAWITHKTWPAHEQTINRLAWAHPRFGQILASCSDDTSLKIWEEQDTKAGTLWKERASISEQRPVKDISFCPPHLGLKIAVACTNGRVYIYEAHDVMNLSDWTLEKYFDAFSRPQVQQDIVSHPGVRTLSWNPSKFEAPMLVVGGNGDEQGYALLRVFQYEDTTGEWRMLLELDSHGRHVNSVSWAPNMGRSYHLIASAGQDEHNQLKVHRIKRQPTGLQYEGSTCLRSADEPQGIWRVAWNVTGTILASSADEGVVRLWKCNFKGDWNEIRAIGSAGFAD